MIYFRHFFSYMGIVAAAIVGSFSLLLFGFFLFGYSFTVIDFGYSGSGVLVWDMSLCLMFFFQHSTMICKAFRERMTAIVPHHFQGALYAIASGAVMIVIVLFWQSSEQTLISLQGVSRWVAHGVFFASFMAMMWGMRSLKSFDMLGVKAIQAHLHATHKRTMPLTILGAYRWVRHPLYFFILVLIWSCPDVTVDRLLFNVLFTAWIVLGTHLEERDLVTEYGETYLSYQRKVPMLIPWDIRKCFKSNGI